MLGVGLGLYDKVRSRFNPATTHQVIERENISRTSHSDGEAEFVQQLDRQCLIRVDKFISLLLYYEDQETRRSLVKDALVLWKPDIAPKRLYQRILKLGEGSLSEKLSERRLSAWPPGLFLQLQILQMVEIEQAKQEEEHLAGSRVIPEDIFVERFIQKLVIASMAIPSDMSEKSVGGRLRREARNIFILCVALCQVLRDYTSSQARVIYQAATQSEDDRTDNAHSVTKRKIMNALLDRFNEFLREEKLADGERRLERQEGPRQKLWQPVVQSTLSYLSPWGAIHVLDRPYPRGKLIPELTVLRGLSKKSWQILANCATALICPDCFANLTVKLLFPIGQTEEPVPQPGDVLAVPVFYNLSSANPPDRPERSQGRNELEDLKLLVEIHEERRRAQKNRTLRLAVVLDDLPPVEHDLIRDGAEFVFDVAEKATYLRIYSLDEDRNLLLAGTSIRPAWYSGERIQERLVGLGGQTVELLVTPPSGKGADSVRAKVRLKYHEAFWGKRLLLGWDRTWHRCASAYAARPYHIAAGFVLFIAALLASILLPLRPQSPEQTVIVPVTSKSPEASSTTPTPTPDGRLVEDQPTNTPRRDAGRPDKNPTGSEIAQRLPSRNAGPLEPYDRGTRTLSAAESRRQLREVKKVFIRVEGPEVLANRVRPAVEAALPATIEVLTAGNESGADAHLIIRLASDGQTASATARLVNRDGRALWPVKALPPIKKNTAAAEEIGKEVGNALSDEIKRAATAGGP